MGSDLQQTPAPLKGIYAKLRLHPGLSRGPLASSKISKDYFNKDNNNKDF